MSLEMSNGKQEQLERAEKFIQKYEEGPDNSSQATTEFFKRLREHLEDRWEGYQQYLHKRSNGLSYRIEEVIDDIFKDDFAVGSEVLNIAVDVFRQHKQYPSLKILLDRYLHLSSQLPHIYNDKFFQELYDEAMQKGVFDSAHMLANLDYIKQHKSEQWIDNETRALEEWAKDLLAVKEIENEKRFMRYAVQVYPEELKTVFYYYKFRKDEDGYGSKHPSSVAIEIAKRLCELNMNHPVQAANALREFAQTAQLGKLDPVFYKNLREKATLKAHAKNTLTSLSIVSAILRAFRSS